MARSAGGGKWAAWSGVITAAETALELPRHAATINLRNWNAI